MARTRRRLAAEALLLACLMVAVAVLGLARITHPEDWLPATAQIDEEPRGDSAPADTTQAGQADLVSLAVCPTSLLPRELHPTRITVWWLVSGECRPGYRDRIDRPPRAA